MSSWPTGVSRQYRLTGHTPPAREQDNNVPPTEGIQEVMGALVGGKASGAIGVQLLAAVTGNLADGPQSFSSF